MTAKVATPTTATEKLVVLSDLTPDWLRKEQSHGQFVHSFGGSGRGELKIPHGIAADQDGFLFACDIGNCNVQVF